MTRRPGVPAAALVLLVASLAAAQVPEAPAVPLGGGSVRVAWTWTPSTLTVEQGSFVDLTATASILFTDAVCPQTSSLVVSAVLVPEPDTVGLKTDPLAIEAVLTVPAGAYGGPAPELQAQVQVPFQLLIDLGTEVGSYQLLPHTTITEPTCAPTSPEAGSGVEGEGESAFTVLVGPTSQQVEFHPPHEDHGAGSFDLFLEPGASRTAQVNASGRFTYHDHFKPDLKGVLRVEDGAAGAATVQVTAQGFNPAEVTIRPGGNVTWTNADRVAHTVSADELHPEHAVVEEHHEGDGDDHGQGGEGNATTDGPPTDLPPPRNSPGLEGLGLAGALAVAAAGLRRRGRA